MKKNILYCAYCAVFVAVCALPAALTPFVKADDNKEKRELAQLPKPVTDGKLNFDYFDEFDSWFSEHFAWRSKLVTADGELKATVFGTSPNSDVIVGTDGWLYYGETTDDFLNINTLSGRGVSNIRHNLQLLSDYCEACGADFIFTVAPNKNSLYPEHMPFNYVESADKGNYELLAESLADAEWFCDLKTALLAADSNIPLYHKEDTHWNNLGAYVGHLSLMGALGHETCPAGNWTTRNDRQGDLAAMIYPSAKADDMQVYSDYVPQYTYMGHFRSFDDVTIRTSCEGKSGSLLMYRDSYGEAIIPFIAECFSSCEFTRNVPYQTGSIATGAADTVILEIVERNIPNLQKYAPVMPAPEADISSADVQVQTAAPLIKAEQAGMYTHIYGEIPEQWVNGSPSVIYVTAGGTTYEAFSCFEDKLLGREGETSDNGFSLYISADEDISTDDITITAVSPDGRAAANK
jgi:hypothetical protein